MNQKPRSTRAASTAEPMLMTAFAARGLTFIGTEPVSSGPGFVAKATNASGGRFEALGWCPAAAERELARLVRS